MKPPALWTCHCTMVLVHVSGARIEEGCSQNAGAGFVAVIRAKTSPKTWCARDPGAAGSALHAAEGSR
jgi:hypothetical protein